MKLVAWCPDCLRPFVVTADGDTVTVAVAAHGCDTAEAFLTGAVGAGVHIRTEEAA